MYQYRIGKTAHLHWCVSRFANNCYMPFLLLHVAFQLLYWKSPCKIVTITSVTNIYALYPCGVSGAELPLLTFDHRRHQICACWWIGIPCSFSQLFPLRLQSHKSDQIFVFFVPKNSNRIHLLGSFHYLCHTWICASTHSPKTPKLQCHKTSQSFPYKLWWFICWMIHPTAASEVCHWLNWNFIPFPALTVTLHSTFQLFKTFPIPNICLWGAH